MTSRSNFSHNFQETCRVCAKISNKMISLFGIRKKGLMLADMLAICTQNKIQRTDLRPSNICHQCLTNLEISFDFYNLVKSSEDRFQRIVSNANETTTKQPAIENYTPDTGCSVIEQHLKVEFNEESATILSNQTHYEQLRGTNDNLADANDIWKTELNAHRQELYQRRRNRLFECFMCKKKLKTFKDTRYHLKRHREATPFKCNVCSMNFSARQFEQHLCKGQSVQCEYCFDCFQTTTSLLEHLECHKEQHNLHKCTDCSKIFSMVYLLECHRNQHGTVEKPHVCHVCNRGFRVNFLLTKHLATHSDERRKCINRNCFPMENE